MIKKIHYCWFGSSKPESVRLNIQRWSVLNPDFEIMEWNESNTHLDDCSFSKKAMKQKKWCFISDIVRLHALIEHGGFYLDTDVELYRPLNELMVDKKRLILGYMYDCALGTAVIYAPPQHPVLKAILALYEEVRPNYFPVNNTVFTDYFINKVEGFLLNGKKWQNDMITVYPKEVFEQPAFIRSHGFSIHHCCGSWMPGKENYFNLNLDSLHQIKWLKRKINTALALRRNEFYPYYRAALKGISLNKDYEWSKNNNETSKARFQSLL